MPPLTLRLSSPGFTELTVTLWLVYVACKTYITSLYIKSKFYDLFSWAKPQWACTETSPQLVKGSKSIYEVVFEAQALTGASHVAA